MLSKAKAKAAEAQAAATAAAKDAKDVSKAAVNKAAEGASKAAEGAAKAAAEVTSEGGGMKVAFDASEKEIDSSLVPANVTKAGWLQKAGGADGSKPKKKRFFVCGDFCMAYYDKEPAKGGKLKGTFDLRETTEVGPSDAEPFEMNLVQSDGHFYRLFAASDPERENWLFAIESFSGYVTGRAEVLGQLEATAASLTEQLSALAATATEVSTAAAEAPAAVAALFPASGDGVADRGAAVETIGASVGELEGALATVADAQANLAAVAALIAKLK